MFDYFKKIFFVISDIRKRERSRWRSQEKTNRRFLKSDTQLRKYIYFKKHFYNIKMMQTENHLHIMKVERICIHLSEYNSIHQ